MVKVLYVRHSQTMFNVEKKKQKATGIEKVKLNGMIQAMRNFDFIDSDLTPEGVEVTQKAIKENEHFLKGVKYLLVSPLIRTLHTAEILFQTNLINPNLKVLVHPGICPKLTTVYNVPFKWIEQKERFKNADFTIMNKLFEKYGFGWFAHELHTPEHKANLSQITEQNRNLPIKEQVVAVLDYMQKIYPSYGEERKEKYLKMIDFHLWMEQLIADNHIKDNELCVVAHSSVLKLLVGKEFDERFLPYNVKKMGNTEFLSFEISESRLSIDGHKMHEKTQDHHHHQDSNKN